MNADCFGYAEALALAVMWLMSRSECDLAHASYGQASHGVENNWL